MKNFRLPPLLFALTSLAFAAEKGRVADPPYRAAASPLSAAETASATVGGLPARLARLAHHNPGLIVDAGVGLWGWPFPCDRNGDGRPDLIMVSAGAPDRGAYYFENTGTRDPATGAEVFKAPVRLGDGRIDLTPSYLPDGTMRVLGPGVEYPDFLQSGADRTVKLPVNPKSIPSSRLRHDQWSYVDFDGDGRLDLVVGRGDWADYGWHNAYDTNGRWVNGPLHGFVYVLKNQAASGDPTYAKPVRLEADGRPVDVYGSPSPVFADFRGTGKLDLICGEFMDGLTFFENVGTRTAPRYATGRRLRHNGAPLTMHLEMIVVVAYDWNKDGRPDLVVAQEDGRVAWLENTGQVVDNTPQFLPPRFFRQQADEVKFGALTAPVAVDWDGDGETDLLSGNTAGEIGFIKNLGGNPPKWAAPVLLEAGGQPIRIMAGYNGSIQGPAEAKWGYTNLGVGDWDGDGLPDILVNTIVGKILWFKNVGTRTQPRLAPAQPVQVAWPGPAPKPAWNWWDPAPGELAIVWRCSPCVIDLDRDGLADLVAPDHEGYLAFYRQVVRDGRRVLLPGQRIFRGRGVSEFDSKHAPQDKQDGLLRLNKETAGRSGRRTFCFADWDGDGKLDLLVNSSNIDFLRNVSTKSGEWVFEQVGPVDGKRLAGHSTCPTTADWNRDGLPDLLTGAEDGFFYYLPNPRTK
jgi:hypothetical protein